MPNAAILVVGDEILAGHTQDTNSNYLANRLRSRGIELRRVVTVPDTPEEVVDALQGLVRARPDFIFVCGGIGPTPDDRTYEAVARAAGLRLVVTPGDREWIEARVAKRGYGRGLLDDPAQAEGMLRMVRRPEGSEPIPNPVGAALGSVVRIDASVVFVLPGVPRELRAMMEGEVEPRFLPTGQEESMGEFELVGEEARLYAVMKEIEAAHPGLRLGSYPQDDRGRILLRAVGPKTAIDDAFDRVQRVARGRGRRVR